MGSRRFKKFDILAGIVRRAEELGQSPQDTFLMGIPFVPLANWLRDGNRITPKTILTLVEEYSNQSLLRRSEDRGKSLKIRLHGNAWNTLDIAAKTDSNLDIRTPLYRDWICPRFLGLTSEQIEVKLQKPIYKILEFTGLKPEPENTVKKYMDAPLSNLLCKGVTSSRGLPCPRHTRVGFDYCYNHEPSIADLRREVIAKNRRLSLRPPLTDDQRPARLDREGKLFDRSIRDAMRDPSKRAKLVRLLTPREILPTTSLTLHLVVPLQWGPYLRAIGVAFELLGAELVKVEGGA